MPDTVAADPVQCSRSMPVDALPCADRQALQMLSPMLWGLVWARPALYWAVYGCTALYTLQRLRAPTTRVLRLAISDIGAAEKP